MNSVQFATRKKKVISAEHQAKLIAGRIAAKAKRERSKVSSESIALAFSEFKKISKDIDVQLESVKEDVIAMHKIMVQIDRAIISQHWVQVSACAAALHAFALNVSRRVETCSAQATAATKVLAFFKAKQNA